MEHRLRTVASSRRSWLLLVAAALVAVVGLVSAPVWPASADVTLRTFDGISTVAQKNNVWKHMAVLGDKYVIFDDRGIIQGPALIRDKWPFLPERFTHDLDGVAVHFSKPGFFWRHTWVKGTEAITFDDTGMLGGPTQQSQSYDGISTFNRDISFGNIGFVGVKDGSIGSGQVFFVPQLSLPPTNRSLSGEVGLPADFQQGLDEISFEREPIPNGSFEQKVSYYKDNERLILQNGRQVERVRLDVKWPFLNAFRTAQS
jgi:hypothetical protein